MEIRGNFTDEFFKVFPDSDSLIIDNMSLAKGESLFYLGKYEDANRILQDRSNKNQTNPWIVIRWGDLYNPVMRSIAPDKDHSKQLYEMAIERSLDAYDRETVEKRLSGLVKEDG